MKYMYLLLIYVFIVMLVIYLICKQEEKNDYIRLMHEEAIQTLKTLPTPDVYDPDIYKRKRK